MNDDERMFEPFPGSDATCFIQWKGTEVCVDFGCPCLPEEHQFSSHYDGDFMYYIQCPHCEAIYEVGTQVKFRRLGPDEKPQCEPKRAEADEENPR